MGLYFSESQTLYIKRLYLGKYFEKLTKSRHSPGIFPVCYFSSSKRNWFKNVPRLVVENLFLRLWHAVKVCWAGRRKCNIISENNAITITNISHSKKYWQVKSRNKQMFSYHSILQFKNVCRKIVTGLSITINSRY